MGVAARWRSTTVATGNALMVAVCVLLAGCARADHTDEFAGVWLANEPWVRIVVAFTDNLEGHCAALRDIVAHPGRLEVVLRDHTVQDRRRIRAEIEPLMTPDGPIQGLAMAGIMCPSTCVPTESGSRPSCGLATETLSI
jgi:hypothetical protein